MNISRSSAHHHDNPRAPLTSTRGTRNRTLKHLSADSLGRIAEHLNSCEIRGLRRVSRDIAEALDQKDFPLSQLEALILKENLCLYSDTPDRRIFNKCLKKLLPLEIIFKEEQSLRTSFINYSKICQYLDQEAPCRASRIMRRALLSSLQYTSLEEKNRTPVFRCIMEGVREEGISDQSIHVWKAAISYVAKYNGFEEPLLCAVILMEALWEQPINEQSKELWHETLKAVYSHAYLKHTRRGRNEFYSELTKKANTPFGQEILQQAVQCTQMAENEDEQAYELEEIVSALKGLRIDASSYPLWQKIFERTEATAGNWMTNDGVALTLIKTLLSCNTTPESRRLWAQTVPLLLPNLNRHLSQELRAELLVQPEAQSSQAVSKFFITEANILWQVFELAHAWAKNPAVLEKMKLPIKGLENVECTVKLIELAYSKEDALTYTGMIMFMIDTLKKQDTQLEHIASWGALIEGIRKIQEPTLQVRTLMRLEAWLMELKPDNSQAEALLGKVQSLMPNSN